jgi:hypothetical protein
MQATEPQGEDKQKRTHHRSPAYPMLNLEEALEKARLVYNADKRSFTSRSGVVKHLGYKDENSGIGNRELSSLKQYGLLEEKGGEYRISDAAYAILFLSADSAERGEALRQAAVSPTIFKDLWSKYGHDASDGTLRDFLIHKKEFNPASVDQVVSNYKATILFAKLTGVSYTEEGAEEIPEMSEVQQLQTPVKQAPLPPGKITPDRPPVPGTRQDVFSLTEGPATFQWPAVLSPEGFEDLSAWLDILKRKIGRSVVTTFLIDKVADGYVMFRLGGAPKTASFASIPRSTIKTDVELARALIDEGAPESQVEQVIETLEKQPSCTITL